MNNDPRESAREALPDRLPSDADLARVLDRDAANEKRRQFLAQSAQNPRLALAIDDYKKALEPTPEPPPRPATTSERQEYQGPTAVPTRTRRDTLETVASINVAPGLDPRRTPTQKRIAAPTATTGKGGASASGSASTTLLTKEEVSPWQTEGQAALAIDKAALPSAHAPAPTPAPVSTTEGAEPASLGSHRRPIVATWRDPRRRGIALALGLVVLAAVVWLLWPKPTSKESMGLTGPAGSNHSSRGVEAPPPQTAAPTVPAEPSGTASPEPSTSSSTPAAEPSAQPAAPTAKTPTPKRPADLPAQTAATAPPPAPSGTAAPVAPAPSPPVETATPSTPPPTTPPPAPAPPTKPSPDDEPRLWK